MLRVMEALAQKFVRAARAVHRWPPPPRSSAPGFALTEYLEAVLLKGKNASPVALFPQYRDVQDLVALTACTRPTCGRRVALDRTGRWAICRPG
jgi:hypothetical protein